MIRQRLPLVAAVTFALVTAIALVAKDDPADLMRRARQLESSNRRNQAYQIYHQLIRQHGSSPQAVEARYRLADHSFGRKHWWGAISMLQGHAEKVDAAWQHRYRYLLARARVEQGQQHATTAEWLREAVKTLQQTRQPQRHVDHARLYLARALAGHWRYAAKTPQDRRDEDLERIGMIDGVYLQIVGDNGDRGDMAAQARFERAMFWATHMRNLTGTPSFFPNPPRMKLSQAGKDYDRRFRDATAKALVQLEEIERRFPGAWAERAAYARAWIHERMLLDLPRAVALYRQQQQKHPGELRDNAEARIRAITAEQLDIAAQAPFRPGTTIALPFTVRNIQRTQVRIYPIELDQLWDAGLRDSDPTHHAIRYVARRRPQPIRTIDWATGCKDDHLGCRGKLEVPLPDGPGAWLLEARGQQRERHVLLVATELALTSTAFADRTIVTVTNIATGQPVAGARVGVLGLARRRREQGVPASLVTDEDGVATLQMSGHRRQLLIGARAGDQQVLCYGASHHQRHGGAAPFRAYVTTDRPLYRPGKQVRFKVLVRRHREGRYVSADGAKLRVRVLDPRGDALFDEHAVADADGSFAGELELKEKATLGMYRVVAQVDGRDQHWYGQSQHGAFRVEEYRKPEFTVRVAPGQGDYIPGDEIEMTVSARYYHGAPVRMGTVTYNVTWQPYQRPASPSWQLSTQPGQRGGHRGWQPRRVCLQGTGTTDENGELTLRWKTYKDAKALQEALAPRKDGEAKQAGDEQPRQPKKAGGAPVPPGRRGLRSPRGRGRGPGVPVQPGAGNGTQPVGSARFSVSVSVVDKARRQISGGGSLVVAQAGIVPTLRAPANLVAVGKAATFGATLMTTGGAPVQTTAHVAIDRHDGKDFAERVATVAKVRTGADGRATFEFTPPRSGFYRVKLTAADRRDNSVDTQVLLLAADAGATDATLRQANGDWLLPERPRYESGEVARFCLTRTNYTGPAHVLVHAGGALFDRRTVRVEGGVAVFDLPLTAEMTPNVHVDAIIPGGGGDPKAGNGYQPLFLHRELVVRPADKLLSVSVDPDQPRYRPGEPAKIALRVTDRGGAPVQTAMWLTAFDTRVLAIQPELARDIVGQFYGHRRPRMLRTQWSQQWRGSTRDTLLIKPSRLRQGSLPRSMSWQWHGYFAGLQGVGLWDTGKRDENQAPGDDPRAHLQEAERFKDADDAMSADGMGRPGPARAPMAEGRRSRAAGKSAMREDAGAGAGPGQAAPEEPAFVRPTVRENFKDTAHWSAHIRTDADGRATVEYAWPDNLTTWKITARAAHDDRFGQTSATVETAKLVALQMATPRFFTERDEVVLSAVISNQLRTRRVAKLVLKLAPGGPLALARDTAEVTHTKQVTLKPGKDYRMDWRVAVVGSGRTTVEMQVLTEVDSDAVRKRFPVVRYGITKHEGDSGAMIGTGKQPAGDGTASLVLNIPEQRDVASTQLKVVLAPSVAVAALEALPYLADYPYGCVEQTMSRFGPSVLVKRTLVRLGLPLEAITGGKQGQALPAGTWGKPHFRKYKALRDAQLDAMVESGLARLYAFQHGDGGWGWWKHDDTDSYMTAYVVDGLLTARACDVPVPQGRIDRGLAYLQRQLLDVTLSRLEPVDPKLPPEARHTRYSLSRRHQLCWLLYVVTRDFGRRGERAQGELAALIEVLARHDDGLSDGARALLALAAQQAGKAETAKATLAELVERAQVDTRAGHVSWTRTRGWYRWYHDPIETSAFALRALLRIDPESQHIPGVVRYLTDSRQGYRWHSTKSTAIAVGALVEYLGASGELDPDYRVTVKVNGKVVGTVRFDQQNLLGAENILALHGDAVTSGPQRIELIKEGKGNLYYAAFATYFSKEDEIDAAGYRIAVRRSFVRVRKDPSSGALTREPMTSGCKLVSGDIVEVTLVLDSDREYRYACLEERKAAGLEPLRQTSGRGPGIATHMEMRDTQVVIFASRVPKGVSQIRYRLRAEAPGTFCALPLTGYLMYAPDIRANSRSFRLTVTDE